MKLTVEQIAFKDVSTSKGMSKQVGIRSGGLWYNGWAGSWSNNLKTGDVIDLPVEEVTKNGTTYRNIKPPKATTSAAGGAVSAESLAVLKELTAAIVNLTSAVTLATMSQGSGLEEPEAPAAEFNPDDIPF